MGIDLSPDTKINNEDELNDNEIYQSIKIRKNP